MPNPEGGPLDQVSGSWGTIEFVTPDFLEPVRDAVNTFFSLLINILNILLAVLEVLKVFIGAFLDPIVALIEAILALIQQILNDLRNAGLYIHGDFYIIKGPDFKELRGGFESYEQRMITRLVDKRDPNRPDISQFSACIAVFLYIGVDISNVQRILRLLQGILQLFNRKPPKFKTVGQVTGVQARYGIDGATALTFGKGLFSAVKSGGHTPFNAVNLTWAMAPVPGNFLTNFAQFAPKGFIIEISTLRDGLPLFYDKQVDLAEMELSQAPGKIQTGIMLDQNGDPAILTGGFDQITTFGKVEFNDAVNFTGIKPNFHRVYTAKSIASQAPIDLSQLKDGSDYYLQKSFYVPVSASLFYPGRGYGMTIPYKDLPLDADWELAGGGKVKRGKATKPTSYFVRIRAVSRAIRGPNALEDRAWNVNNSILREPQPSVEMLNKEVTQGDVGDPSFPLEIAFPDANTDAYLQCVTEALALLVLCRADIGVLLGKDGELGPAPDQMQGDVDVDDNPIPNNWNGLVSKARRATQLETKAQILMPRLTGRRQSAKYFNRAKVSPASFRRKLRKACLNLANDLIALNNPPASLIKTVVDRCEPLLGFTFADADIDVPLFVQGMSIFDALSDASTDFGLALNQTSLGYDSDKFVADAKNNIYRGREKLVPGPHFFFNPNANTLESDSSVEFAPVLYSKTTPRGGGDPLNPIFCEYVRNLIPDEVFTAAQFALQVAAGPIERPQEEGWIAIRLFPQGLPDIDRFFDQLLAMLKAIQAAIQGLADLINKYIEMLQSRIIELQAFLNRINAIIQQILNLFISIPPTSGLVVVANGTDGVLSALVNADNKPFDPPETYGAGVVLLAGGLPTIALELFKALFSSSE
jgi:hypothetical protein